ncbi:MAG: GyrI-like domain-containing protein [Propionicimonas sp.]|nr:hypothetical protein [Propionicimonas sp.]
MNLTAEPVIEPTLVVLATEPTAVVRHHGVTVSELAPLFDAGYPAIAASGAAVAGPAFALYLGDPQAAFDLELGFPVSQPLPAAVPGTVTVEGSSLPGGHAFTLSHVGAYDTLAEGWGRLAAAAAARGFRPTCFYEVYVTEPTAATDPATLRTDLFLVGTPADR